MWCSPCCRGFGRGCVVLLLVGGGRALPNTPRAEVFPLPPRMPFRGPCWCLHLPPSCACRRLGRRQQVLGSHEVGRRSHEFRAVGLPACPFQARPHLLWEWQVLFIGPLAQPPLHPIGRHRRGMWIRFHRDGAGSCSDGASWANPLRRHRHADDVGMAVSRLLDALVVRDAAAASAGFCAVPLQLLGLELAIPKESALANTRRGGTVSPGPGDWAGTQPHARNLSVDLRLRPTFGRPTTAAARIRQAQTRLRMVLRLAPRQRARRHALTRTGLMLSATRSSASPRLPPPAASSSPASFARR